jgi:D-arabinitol 4-dehydrogenase
VTASGGTELYQTTFDRTACRIGIVHLGYGAFHRAHQAVYVDDYMEATGDTNWGIASVNLRASESADFKTALGADGYLLKTTTPEGERSFRMVRSHMDYVDWSREAERAQSLLALASVQAVTMTVTESGYYLNDDWSLNVDDPIIRAEIDDGEKHSVYAYLAAGLEKRAEALDQPLSVLCCDNIRANGHMLERNFLTYLKHVGRHDLAGWVGDKVCFPSSMVDRITPRATPALREEVEALFPDLASHAIHAEAFCQWVLQDHFAGLFTDNGGAEDSVPARHRQHLDHAMGFTLGDGAVELRQVKAGHLIVDTLLQRLLFVETDPRHLRVGEGGERHR